MNSEQHFTALAAPCKSCPYRQDVPSGIWEQSEYEKLPMYDGSMFDQMLNGGTAIFMCHQQNGCLCSGWLGCHSPENLLAIRLEARRSSFDPAVFNYESPVALFSSGAAAAAHGMAEISAPGLKAKRTITSIMRKHGAKRNAGGGSSISAPRVADHD